MSRSTRFVTVFAVLVCLLILLLPGTRLFQDQQRAPVSESLTLNEGAAEEALTSSAEYSVAPGNLVSLETESSVPAVSDADSDTTSSDPVVSYNDPASIAEERQREEAFGSSDVEAADSNDSDPEMPRLSQQVFEVIREVQTRQLEGQWEEALNEMNALYQRFDELNSFEQTTLLNFYTNTLLQLEMLPEAISAFSQLLTVENLNQEVNARALMALGQLHSALGERETAVAYYESWLEFTRDMENMQERTQRVSQLLFEARGEVAN